MMEGQLEGQKVVVLASFRPRSALSFVVAVGVLWTGLLFMGAGSSFVGGRARPRAVYVVRGWGADVWCRRGVAALHRLYGCHVALLATWPLYPGVRKDGGGKWVLT